MEFLPSSNHKFLFSLDTIPNDYRSYRIPGAKPLYVQGGFGNYLTQIIASQGCNIQLNLFKIIKKAYLHPFTVFPLLPLHFMLQGNIRCKLEGFGEAWLRENFYNLFYIPENIRHQAWFKKGFYISFHIDFSPEYLEWLATKHHELKDVKERLSEHSVKGVQQHYAPITPLIRNMIDEIMYRSPLEEPEKSTFTEIRGKELLLKYVQDTPINKAIISRNSKELMNNLISYINDHLDYPHSIRSLSRRYSLSETALRRQFMQYTGQTIGRFLLDKRMEKAMELLVTTTLPVRDIAMQVGYYDFSSFDRAFVREFGHSPGYYRR